jgi:hypothetical protein
MNKAVVDAFSLKPSVWARADDSNARDQGVVCVQNIGPAERRKRLTFGLTTLVAGLAIGILLILTGANHWSRLILFLPFAGGAIGFIQAREKT